MAVDEVVGIHEKLEFLTGIDWQMLYAPVVAVGGVGWLLAMFDLGRLGQLAWLSGAGAWLIA